MKIFLNFFILLLLVACATTSEIKVLSHKQNIWMAYSDGAFDFQGKFTVVDYSGIKTVGIRLEEPLGPAWKKIGVREGDVWMGMADLIFFKAEDWKKAWSIVRGRIQQETITVGILKRTKLYIPGRDAEAFDKELAWEILRR